MVKDLQQLLQDIDVVRVVGDAQRAITDLVQDSRKVAPGCLFVAVRGVNVDGHAFLDDVAAKGAAAIVCEQLPATPVAGVTYIVVENSHVALARLASAWYDHPSAHLKLVGVTGTNGKTTTATLLYELARLLGFKAGLLSTVRNMIDTREEPAVQTTPDHLTLNALLAQMVEAGCDYAFMEVSSHACDQHRIDGLTFAGGVFTNLTRDHLDYHLTVDNYIRAKKRFFDLLPATAFALVNVDDKVGMVMTQNTRALVKTYSLRGLADFKCRVIEEQLDGTILDLDGTEVNVLFTGRFNAYNLTAVYGAARLLGLDRDEVMVAMSRLTPVDGRFETIAAPQGFTAIVDYAHTPDALVNVLDTIADILSHTGIGKIITVCGCGGNRDKGKRPIMAREAALRSNTLVLTSDNPRDEDPDAILDEMKAGLDAEQLSRTLVIADRRSAIATACRLATRGDVVLVAGKGHEPYQEVKGVRHHFDDREEIRKVLNIAN